MGGVISFLDTLTYIFFYLPGFFLIGWYMVPDYVVKLGGVWDWYNILLY